MPKRKYNDGSKEDRWKRKLKKYEKRLNKRRRIDTSDEDELVLPLTPPPVFSGEPITDEIIAPVLPVPTPPPAASPPSPPSPPLAAQPAAPAHETPATPVQLAPVVPLSAHPARTPDAYADQPSTSSTMQVPSCSNPSLPLGTGLNATAATTAPISEETEFTADPELLLALGDLNTEMVEWGRDIYGDLAKRWEPILKEGMKKETREELLKKHLFPKNCPLTKAPVLNPEIGAMLTESARNRDSRIIKKQNQIGCALAILGRTMTDILAKSMDMTDILRNLTDAAKVLADAHYAETETRRSLITPMVDKTFIEPFKDRKRDSHLFGEKLGEFIKVSRGIQKTGKLIQPTNLNSKNPSSSSRPTQQRGSRAPPAGRGGGVRSSVQYYRRRAPPYPAPAPRATRAAAASPPQPAPRTQKQTTAQRRH